MDLFSLIPIIFVILGVLVVLKPDSAGRSISFIARFNDKLLGGEQAAEKYHIRRGLVQVFGYFLVFFGISMLYIWNKS